MEQETSQVGLVYKYHLNLFFTFFFFLEYLL